MNEEQRHLANLTEIRSLMERSNRFLSLSGLSGISAGIIALIGAAMVYLYLGITPFTATRYLDQQALNNWGMNYQTFLLLDAALVAIFAFIFGLYFTWRKSKKKGYKLLDSTSKKLAINIIIPMATGGLFCLILLYRHGYVGIVAPSTLIFYGLTLLNVSKFTLDDIRYLGICEIILGLFATWFDGYGLLFWSIGFGVLHIVYGTFMYYKYDR